jgi:hypothetical protein
VSCWNTLISDTSPSELENSSMMSTVAERPDSRAVHVCVVICTTDSPQPSIRGFLMDRSQERENGAHRGQALMAAVPAAVRQRRWLLDANVGMK